MESGSEKRYINDYLDEFRLWLRIAKNAATQFTSSARAPDLYRILLRRFLEIIDDEVARMSPQTSNSQSQDAQLTSHLSDRSDDISSHSDEVDPSEMIEKSVQTQLLVNHIGCPHLFTATSNKIAQEPVSKLCDMDYVFEAFYSLCLEGRDPLTEMPMSDFEFIRPFELLLERSCQTLPLSMCVKWYIDHDRQALSKGECHAMEPVFTARNGKLCFIPCWVSKVRIHDGNVIKLRCIATPVRDQLFCVSDLLDIMRRLCPPQEVMREHEGLISQARWSSFKCGSQSSSLVSGDLEEATSASVASQTNSVVAFVDVDQTQDIESAEHPRRLGRRQRGRKKKWKKRVQIPTPELEA